MTDNLTPCFVCYTATGTSRSCNKRL